MYKKTLKLKNLHLKQIVIKTKITIKESKTKLLFYIHDNKLTKKNIILKFLNYSNKKNYHLILNFH